MSTRVNALVLTALFAAALCSLPCVRTASADEGPWYILEGHLKHCEGFNCYSFEPIRPLEMDVLLDLWRPGLAVHDPAKGKCPIGSTWSYLPLPDELGQLLAVRLTPTAYPMKVYSVHYPLIQGTAVQMVGSTIMAFSCNANLPHRVEVYVGTSKEPSNSPSQSTPQSNPHLVASIQVPQPAPLSLTDRNVKVVLPDPVELHDGEYLFVAVEMAAQGSGENLETMCIPACVSNTGSSVQKTTTPQTNFWSLATHEPYNWKDLDQYYASANAPDAIILAEGEIPAFFASSP